jgi:hypothetical protein
MKFEVMCWKEDEVGNHFIFFFVCARCYEKEIVMTTPVSIRRQRLFDAAQRRASARQLSLTEVEKTLFNKTTAETINPIDSAIDSYMLSADVSYIQSIFDYRKITPFLEGFLKPFRQETHLSLQELVEKYPFVKRSIRLSLNIYEGGVYCKLKKEELLACSIIGLHLLRPTITLDTITEYVVDKTFLETKDTWVLLDAIGAIIKNWSKKKSSKIDPSIKDIFTDIVRMDVYDSDIDIVRKRSEFIDTRRWENPFSVKTDQEIITAEFHRLMSLDWKTRWGKQKALSLNYPARLKYVYIDG